MPTISHITEKIVSSRPLLQEAIIEDIVSFGSVAEKIKPDIEKELGKEAKLSAIVMALRRIAENLSARSPKKRFDYSSEISMKTNICDIGIIKTHAFFSKMKSIYSIVDYEQGDALNIIQGNNEVSIIANERYFDKIKKALAGEKIIRQEKSLVIVSLNFPKEYVSEPGVIATITRKLAWNGVNLIEIILTFKELNCVINKKDATKAYNALQELIEGS
ncbi:MAG: ACT domain-containing protein [Candidatus Woesearchaeota archaeon]|nr:ACT domain-containing protein [Candidatus Woesearchaeota archaeon]